MLEHGVGISLINSVPEELLFATLSGIRVSGDMSFILVVLKWPYIHVVKISV